MYQGRFYKVSVGVILILLILLLLDKVDYIFGPLRAVISFLITPLLISAFLYYLLRPLVRFLTLKIHNKTISILLTFLFVVTLITFVSFFGGSIIRTQISNLIKDFSNYYESARGTINSLISYEGVFAFLREYDIQNKISNFVEGSLEVIRTNLLGFFSTLTNIGTIIVLIPFILYYFLKDDFLIYSSIMKLVPEKNKEKINSLFKNIDNALSKYIAGQLIIAIILGFLTFIGYLIIGLPNALILAIITTITSFIPFIGAILGILPAVFIALTTNLLKVLQVIIVMVLVQQLEGNIIQPRIQGNRLEIHPVMVILLVLSFITLFGFLGALFAVPIYAVIRVIVWDIYQNYVLNWRQE